MPKRASRKDDQTTIKFTESVFRMMADLLQVRINHLRGRYR